MRKVIVCILLLMGSLVAVAQAQSNAKIKFNEREFDFGDIYQGDVVTHVFKFENNGDAPLLLTNISTTCGCTAPEWPREPVLPGETGEITVKFNSAHKSGIQNKIITVYSNANTPQEKLKIRTNVLPKSAKAEKQGR
ncbi:DUF1573 domain-containing protein [Rapidithrix thailandica]|uniref:DUF1573 domain-containing protein n=1 Tax=Rapidithrix thailandica TaxID=413964 RepID=A0AAW9SAW5_9BACT